MTQKWTAADVPAQQGRVAVVTGANSGIGVTAIQLAKAAGATGWLTKPFKPDQLLSVVAKLVRK